MWYEGYLYVIEKFKVIRFNQNVKLFVTLKILIFRTMFFFHFADTTYANCFEPFLSPFLPYHVFLFYILSSLDFMINVFSILSLIN